MKSVKLKSFRHTAAVAGKCRLFGCSRRLLFMPTALSIGLSIIEACQEEKDSLQKTLRQFRAEEKKCVDKLKGSNKQKYTAGMKQFNTFYDNFSKEISAEISRGKDKPPLEAKFSAMQTKVENTCISLLSSRANSLWDAWKSSLSDIIAMEKLMVKIFASVLTHCIKDKDGSIREEVVHRFGDWIREYPCLFLYERYLKYIGQSLSDKEAGVRKTAVAALGKCLAEADDSLDRFVQRFKGRIVEMVDDPKADVVVCALQSMGTLSAIGALDEQDVEQAEGVLFHEDNSKYTLMEGHGHCDKDFSSARLAAAEFVLSTTPLYKDLDADEDVEDAQQSVRYVEGLLKLLEKHLVGDADASVLCNNPIAEEVFRGCVQAFCRCASFATDWKAIATCLRQHRNRKRAVVAVRFLMHAAEETEEPALTEFLQENLADLVVRFQADHLVLDSLVRLVKSMDLPGCTSTSSKAKVEKLARALAQAYVQHGDKALLGHIAQVYTLELCELEHGSSRMAQTEMKRLKQEVVSSVQNELQRRETSEDEMNLFMAVRRLSSILSFTCDFDAPLQPLLAKLRGEMRKRIQSDPKEPGPCVEFIADGFNVCLLELMWKMKELKLNFAVQNLEEEEGEGREIAEEDVVAIVEDRNEAVTLLETIFAIDLDDSEFISRLQKVGVAAFQQLQCMFSMKYEFKEESPLVKLGWNPSHQLQAKVARCVHTDMELLNEDLAEAEEAADDEEDELGTEQLRSRLEKVFEGDLKTLKTVWNSVNPSMQAELLGTNVFDNVTERISASLLQYTNDKSDIIAEEVHEFLSQLKDKDVERAASLALVTLQLAFQSMIRMEDEEEKEDRLDRILQTAVTLSKQLVPSARKATKETVAAVQVAVGAGMEYAMSELPHKTPFLLVIIPFIKAIGRGNVKALQQKWKETICALPKPSQDAMFSVDAENINLGALRALAEFEKAVGAVTKNSDGVKLSDMVKKYEAKLLKQAKPLDLVTKSQKQQEADLAESDKDSDATSKAEESSEEDAQETAKEADTQKSLHKSVFDDDSSEEGGQRSATAKRKRSSKMESDDLFSDRIDKDSPDKPQKKMKRSAQEEREEMKSDEEAESQQISGFLPSRRTRRRKKQ